MRLHFENNTFVVSLSPRARPFALKSPGDFGLVLVLRGN